MPYALEEPPLQYGDFASWQRRTVDEAAMDRLAEYWRTQLSGASPLLELAGQRRRPSRQSFRGGLLRLDLPAELTSAVRSAALAQGCTLFMVLLASFAATLHRWSGQTELVIGSVSGGRDRPELERVIGYFLRMLVIRVDLRGDPTFRELLLRVRETLLDALCHDGLPFQHLVRALAPSRDLGRSPLFQVTFSIEPPMPQLGPEWEITEMDAGAVASKFDLSLELEDKGELMHARAIYSLDLFEASSIRRLLEDWRGLLGRAVADPERRLRELAGPDELAGTCGRGERP
jgi:non-ribosomal peptide synthetase component F